jgi:pteridine reductase
MTETFPLALVTGAAHRLGKAFALTLAGQGYAIALHYNSSAKKASTTAKEIHALGVPVFPIQADLTDEAQVNQLFSEIDALCSPAQQSPRRGSLGEGSQGASLKVLVNSAAIIDRSDARSMSVADFDSALNTNLRAPFLCAQQAYQRMDAGGLIVNISDVAAQKVWTSFPAYTVSKSALESLTRILACSFAPKVRVNAIAPGLVLPPDDFPVDDWERLVGRLPLKRPADLEEITSALEFLLKNEYITGQTIVVDGGYSLL